MLQFVFSVMSKEHHVKGCCMKIEVIPRLLATMMHIGQAHPQMDVLHQDIVFSLEVTYYPGRVRNKI